MDCPPGASESTIMDGNKEQLTKTSSTTATAEGPSGKYVPDHSSENGSQWASNGSIPDHNAIVASDSNRDSYLLAARNQHVKEPSMDVGVTGLPGNLTTPPLTPPREAGQPLMQDVHEPVNGNRNNVSDSAHANSTSFKAMKGIGTGVGVSTNGMPSREQETSEKPPNTYGSMDVEPPALVILSDAEEEKDDEQPRQEPMDTYSEPAKPEMQVYSEPSSHCNGEVSTSKNVYVGEGSGEAVGDGKNISLQSTRVTSASKDVASSEDEDAEDLDLEIVEEEDTESSDQHGTNSTAATTTTTRRPPPQANNTSTTSSPHSNMPSTVDTKTASTPGINEGSQSHQTAVEAVRRHSKNGHTPSPGHVVDGRVSAPRENQESGGIQEPNRREVGSRGVAPVANVKKAAKVKQFFTTIQQHGNKLGSEVAEQVQELIHAVMNKTASVEEFHQEIQTIMNYPLKDFIIPFLRDNIGYLRTELKESCQELSDVCEVSASSASAVSLTPQLVDEDLPVLPSSANKTSSLSTIRTVSSSTILSSSQHGSSSSSSLKTPASYSTAASSTNRNSNPHSASSSNSIQNHIVHQSGNGTGSGAGQVHSHSTNHVHGTGHGIQSHSHASMDDGLDPTRHGGNKHQVVRTSSVGVKRRRWSNEHGPAVVTVEKDKESSTEKTWPPKRVRTGDVSEGPAAVIISNPRQLPHSYHHPPQPPPPPPGTHLIGVSTAQISRPSDNHVVYTSFPQDAPPRRRDKTLTEDWGHIDMMLSSIQGMVEKTRQSMAMLKERVNTTHVEMERREMERESIIQQRVNEAVDKVKHQSTEEKQRMLLEASKQLRDAVAGVKAEMEGKMQQTQAVAVQEALKEANTQSSSKENCWNCGRRATETCSGCNKARYCGTFCQHKDWANHMHHCASGVQGQAEEVSHEPKRIHHHMSAGEVTLTSSTRGIPVVASPHHSRPTMAIPVNLIGGAAGPQEVNVRLAPVTHSAQGHPDIIIKTERT